MGGGTSSTCIASLSDSWVASLSPPSPSGDSAICLALPLFLLLVDKGGEGDGELTARLAALVCFAGDGEAVLSLIVLPDLVCLASGSGDDSIVLSGSSSSASTATACSLRGLFDFELGFIGDERDTGAVVFDVEAFSACTRVCISAARVESAM